MSDLVTFNPSRALDGNAKASPGAKARFYDTGTTTPRTVYADAGLTVPHPSPLVADATGTFAQVFVSGGLVRAVVQKADGSTLYDLDPCVKVPSGGAGAEAVSFTPTPEVPKTNVQEAIAHLGDMLPTSATWLVVQSTVGGAATLPAGGTWAYFIQLFDTGLVTNAAASVAAGGTTVGAATSGKNWVGFAWKIGE